MNTRFFAFAALALTLAACNNDNENEILNDGPVAAQFTAEIYEAASTRVNSEGTDWTDGDRIGVTGAGFTNVPYKRENGKFVTDGLTIYFQDTETHTFNAYYPYKPDSELEDGFVKVNTSDDQGADIDFLFATGAEGNTFKPVVSFTDKTKDGGPDNSFHHCMSQITLTFKAGDGVDFSQEKPASYTLSGLKHEGTFDTATGTTAVTATSNTPITMQLGGATTSQLIILPQEVTTSPGLSVAYNDETYTTTLPQPSTGKFDTGYAYTYTITLNNQSITVESPEITPWKAGDSNDASATL